MTDRIDDELRPPERCASCGAQIAESEEEDERVFALDDDSVVCFACALERGGEWDEAEHRWARPPLVDDLLRRDHPEVELV